ncbi:MAG TPA: N-acetylmuramoyl-L-alanine amidase [Clostridia bacterium]
MADQPRPQTGGRPYKGERSHSGKHAHVGVGRARILVSIMVLASLAIIVYNQAWGGREQTAMPTGTSLTASITPAASTAPGTVAAGTTAMSVSPTPTPVIRELQLYPPTPIGEPGASQPEMKRWPAAGSVESVRTVDLAAYRGRSRTDRPLEGITVVLDPGHGGIDSGCGWPVGVRNQDIMEKDVALSVAKAARTELERMGARVLFIRDDDTFYSIFCRPALVGQMIMENFIQTLKSIGIGTGQAERLILPLQPIIDTNEDTFAGIMGGSGTKLDYKHVMDIERQYPDWLFLSIHCNAAGGYPDARGLQVYYTSSAVVQHDERIEAAVKASSEWQPSYQNYDDGGRLRLATLLYGSIVAKVPALGNGTPSPLVDQDFAVLREQNLASALIELGFLTNASDRAALALSDTQTRLGVSIADAVYSYYCSPK